MRGKGNLIVFEGPDGAGKSTLARRLAESFENEKIQCQYMSFPGHEPGTLGRLVYDLHHESSKFGINALDPASLQLLHVAAHIDAISTRIRPALERGQWIILDRFWWSTLVYGSIGGVDLGILKRMISVELATWQEIRPFQLFLVGRSKPARTSESVEQFEQLTDKYAELARREEGKYPISVVRTDGTVDESFDFVNKVLAPCLHEKILNTQGQAATGYLSDSEAAETKSLFQETNTTRSECGPAVFSSISPAIPTEVFDTYWRFAAERQEIFFKKLEGYVPPWTSDPVLTKYKFTNAYRASDRVSQYLIKRVIYDGEQSIEEVFFRTILFKLFNRIETWELLLREVGEVTYQSFDIRKYDGVLTSALNAGRRIYSAAYMMPSGKQMGHDKKHRNNLQLLKMMMADDLPQRIATAKTMKKTFDLLRSYPTIGEFLAYQFATDINYSGCVDFSEMEFVIPGPGARDGIWKCFQGLGGLDEADIIRCVCERQEVEFNRLGISFRSLWGRQLQLIDCQNLFCEVGKYSRRAHPERVGKSGRIRIKQKYRTNPEPIDYWYPPKWGLNDLIKTAR